jgi:hypothetical protein
MNLNNITYQPKQSSKKTYKIKEHLSQLASTIKIRMDENQILMDTINNICINIKKSKQQLKKFSSNQNKENAKSELNKNISNLTKTNKNLLIQKKMLFHKYIKLKNKYFTELEPVNTELKLLNDRKFILENIIKRRDFEIEQYETNLEIFYAPLVREEKREIFSNNIDIDEDSIIYNLEKSQTTLLNKLKDFNKYHNKATELKKEKETLVKLIKKLKGKRNINDISMEEKNFLNNKINSRKNKFLQNNQDIINNSLLNSIDGNSSILSDIMNDTINSEYEDEENIEFISLQKNYKPLILTQNLKNKIPKINLEQIEFNKMKFKQEDAEKSLSRELKNFDEIELKKELVKSMIKKEKAKNKKLNSKIINLSKKINMMKKIINSMELNNYKLSNSAIRDKKVGINIGRQFNALSGRNREIMDLKLNYGKGFNFNFNNEKNQEDKNEILIDDKDK